MSSNIDLCLAALSDPTRRAVIEQLARGPASISVLAAPFDIALPSFMRHIQVLETSGLIRTEKTGRVRTCHLETTALLEVQGWLAWQREVWENQKS